MNYIMEFYVLDEILESQEQHNDIQDSYYDSINEDRIKPKKGDTFEFISVNREIIIKLKFSEFGYQIIEINEKDVKKENLTEKRGQKEIYNYLMDNYNFIPSQRPFDEDLFGITADLLLFQYGNGNETRESYSPGVIISDNKIRLLDYTESFGDTIIDSDEHAYNNVKSISFDDIYDVDLDICEKMSILNIYTKKGIIHSLGENESCFRDFSHLKSIIKQYRFLKS